MTVKTDYTREELLALCEQALIPQSEWTNRDSASAQMQIGQSIALLRAGCDFVVQASGDRCGGCVTDAETIWVEFFFEGFNYSESWSIPDSEEERRSHLDRETSYIPTQKRMDDRGPGKDWY